MSSRDLVTRESIDDLCSLAGLPLPPERRARLAPILSGLLVAANDLSRRMANAGHRSIVPILRFPER